MSIKSGGSAKGHNVPKHSQVVGKQSIPKGKARAGLSILVVEHKSAKEGGLEAQLKHLGHTLLTKASTADEARILYRKNPPELVLLDTQLDEQTDGIELAGELLAERRCPMIILSIQSEESIIRRAGEVGVFGYLIKPVSHQSLQAQIEVVIPRFREQEELRREIQVLAQTLEVRKVVERAKGIFMKRLQLDEPAAHRRLLQESQNRRMNLEELAKKIIESEDLLGGSR